MWQEVMKSKCGYCGFSGYQGFENRNNRRNRRNCTLYSKNIPIDFQGKRVLKWISTDFWEMSVKKYELFAEIAVAQSIIFPVTIPLSLRGDKQRI